MRPKPASSAARYVRVSSSLSQSLPAARTESTAVMKSPAPPDWRSKYEMGEQRTSTSGHSSIRSMAKCPLTCGPEGMPHMSKK